MTAVYHVKTSGYDLAYEILEGLALRDTPFMYQNLPLRKRATHIKTYPFVNNGFCLVGNIMGTHIVHMHAFPLHRLMASCWNAWLMDYDSGSPAAFA